MDQESTTNLIGILQNTKEKDIDKYYKQHIESKCYETFTAYMDDLIAQKRLKRQDILARADIPQKYGYKLLSGESHTSNRDKILRICLAMKLSLTETQRALVLYGMQPLYPKNKRDAFLIIAINTSMHSIDDINERLVSYGLSELSTSKY